ncbi:MAG: HD domain-containing protein [Bacteroidales bacterium]|jgi:tRNA nucleotidyltransferase (CCA-adding enzyme)|nr:HD domain-containing protein [Bacteroidales bacterium]
MNFYDLVEAYGLRLFAVGGCVRDEIMGYNPKDCDYVVESTLEEFNKTFPNMVSVGNHFPVFLVDKDGESVEVALTRTEKSNGNGYHDFEVDKIGVSIEEDLFRRDFSINSIAKRYLTGEIIDPYNGRRDIEVGLIRTINPNSFSDDPLRLIRACRFAVRYQFSFDMDTYNSIRENAHRIKYISNNRIVAELKKVVDEGTSLDDFIFGMSVLNILEHVFPLLYKLNHVCAGPEKYHGNLSAFKHSLNVTKRVQERGGNFATIMSALFHDLGKGDTPKELEEQGHHYGHEFRSYELVKQIVNEYPFDCYTRDLMLFCAKNHMKVHIIHKMRVRKLMEFYKSIPKKLYDDFFLMCECDHEFSEEQFEVKKKLDKMKNIVYDVDKINKTNNKEQEVINQMVKFYNTLENIK